MDQRADIQGLRAVAVLLVIFYHFDLGVSGGYLGVDMFFVISGYVITLSALRDIQQHHKFDWRKFYRRRIRRLLPGIAVVAIVTAFASLFILSPFGPQQMSAKMLMSSATYSSNFALLKFDYFSLDPSSNPMLHFWSLAVEEQFYFVWGPIVVAVWAIMGRWKSKSVGRALAVVGVVALLVSLVLFIALARYETAVQNWPGLRQLSEAGVSPARFSFYSPVTRAWEFMSGALLALAHNRWKSAKQNVAASIVWASSAIVLIVVALAGTSNLLDRDSTSSRSFNEVSVLLTVIGTVAIIHAGLARPFTSRLLESKAAVYIGDLSYSLYLWHWPLWTLSVVVMHKSTATTIIVLALTAVFSVVQFNYIEQPIRRGIAITKPTPIQFVVAFVAVAAVGWAAMTNLSPVIGKHLVGVTPYNLVTHVIEQPCTGKFIVVGQAKSCYYPADDPRGLSILVGDSTAKSLSDGFVLASRQLQQDALVFTLPGCAFQAPASPFTPYCDKWRSDVWSAIRALKPDIVAVSNLNALYVDEIGIPDTSITDARKEWGVQVRKLFNKIRFSGARPLLVQPVPRFVFDIRYDISLINRQAGTEPRHVVEGRTQYLNDLEVTSVGEFSSATEILNLNSRFCASDRCTQFIDGKLAYEDSAHLSSIGSLKVSPNLKVAMERLLPREA
ncbi:MAG: acyltransferase family protein [Ilumatobacteraceae bacterium]